MKQITVSVKQTITLKRNYAKRIEGLLKFKIVQTLTHL